MTPLHRSTAPPAHAAMWKASAPPATTRASPTHTAYLQALCEAMLVALAFDLTIQRYQDSVLQRYSQLNRQRIERCEHKSLTLIQADVYVSLTVTVTPDRRQGQQRRHQARTLDKTHSVLASFS